MPYLWGPSRDHDYWAALRADLVPPEERRAVALLASMTDEGRFSSYCMTGELAAMGNLTKRIYLVRRYDKVMELEDGRPKASWCIHAPDRMSNPETDHVVMMRNLIEGEELLFRKTGNPSPMHWRMDPHVVRNPFLAEITGDGHDGDPNADLLECLDRDRECERHVRRMREERDSKVSMLRFRKRFTEAAMALKGRDRLERVVRGERIPDERDAPVMMDQAPGPGMGPRIVVGGLQNGVFGNTVRITDNAATTATGFLGNVYTNNICMAAV